ncbi:hypothetical protein PG984_015244 [Apiospora sp. TS-2023a]
MDMLECLHKGPYEPNPWKPHIYHRGTVRPYSEVAEHFTELYKKWQEKRESGNYLYCIKLEMFYPPCILPACDLESITISQMEWGNRHHGRKILLRIDRFFERDDEVCAVVKDEDENAVVMELWYSPNGSQGPAGGPLKQGQAFILKEPLFSDLGNGYWKHRRPHFLRVDHITDLVWLDMAGPQVPKTWQDCFFSMHEVPLPPPHLALEQPTTTSRHLNESRLGDYDFPSMYQEANAIPPLIDSATFSKPVVTRQSLPERGFGLFTKQPVSAGDLLLCEKALGYVWSDRTSADRYNRPGTLFFGDSPHGLGGGQSRLLVQLIQKLRLNPEIQSDFQQLYRGDYEGVPELLVDGQPVVDTFHVANVIRYNAMGAPVGSWGNFHKQPRIRDFPTRVIGYDCCGLWPLAARANHSCLANCRRSFVGDMVILRATQNLAAGTEVFLNYQTGFGGIPIYGPDAQLRLMRCWGFKCHCALCSTLTGPQPEPLLKKPWGMLRTRINQVNHDPSFAKRDGGSQAISLLTEVEALPELSELRGRASTQLVPNLELAQFYMELSVAYGNQKQYSASVSNAVQFLRLLGFKFKADTAGSQAVSTTAPFTITAWGVPTDDTLLTFVLLVKLYGENHPDQLPAMKEYARVLYSMVLGQAATAYDMDSWFEHLGRS